MRVATLDEVDAAVRGVVDQVAGLDPELRSRYAVERTVSCRVTDLQVVYAARLSEHGLSDVHREPAAKAQVRLRVASDDLLALAQGRLAVPTAWATGRLKVEASVLDLLKLRSLL
ncbi:MAG: sterol transfer family protein [Frankiales bacterium]|nr:sterol transfer family protein [Frankiales bacterium]